MTQGILQDPDACEPVPGYDHPYEDYIEAYNKNPNQVYEFRNRRNVDGVGRWDTGVLFHNVPEPWIIWMEAPT